MQAKKDAPICVDDNEDEDLVGQKGGCEGGCLDETVQEKQLTGFEDYLDVTAWSDGEVEEAEEIMTDSMRIKARKTVLLDEAKRVFNTWNTRNIDWHTEFPELPKISLKPMADLLKLDMWRLYQKSVEMDPTREQWGFLPLMACASKGQIGSLQAESFCERVISAANLVLDEGNCQFSDHMIEMLVILRINRKFMEFMRKHHNDSAKQQFGMSTTSSKGK